MSSPHAPSQKGSTSSELELVITESDESHEKKRQRVDSPAKDELRDAYTNGPALDQDGE